MDSATSMSPCLPCLGLEELCLIAEGTICAGIASGFWPTCRLGRGAIAVSWQIFWN